MQRYALVGDTHQGFKAYGSDKRTQEAIDVLDLAVTKLSHLPVLLFPGDFFDDTIAPNWVKKQLIAMKERVQSQIWVILGGNHDSTKTYTSTSILDVFGEVHNVIVVNSHKAETLDVCGLKILCIPHVKSQTEYMAVVDSLIASEDTWDVGLLHSLVGSGLDLGPNDLNIDLYRLELLSTKVGHIWIGHEHHPKEILPGKVYIPGSTMEFDFGQLGEKYVYIETTPYILPQPRKMVRLELENPAPMDLVKILKLEEDSIYRVDIKAIPIEEYSNIKSVCDLIEMQFAGDVLFNLYKLGHKELTVTAIDAQFDLQTEFDEFCTQNKIVQGRMGQLLADAITKVTIAEENE